MSRNSKRIGRSSESRFSVSGAAGRGAGAQCWRWRVAGVSLCQVTASVAPSVERSSGRGQRCRLWDPFAAADRKSECSAPRHVVLRYLGSCCVRVLSLRTLSPGDDLVSIATADTCSETAGCWLIIHLSCVLWEDRNLPEKRWLARAGGVGKFTEF